MKNVRIQEAGGDFHFFEGIGSDLFWRIFNNNQFAIALTNEEGGLLLQNDRFLKKVVEVPNYVDLTKVLSETGGGEKAFFFERDFQIDTGAGMIRLSFFKIPHNVTGASYIWLASDEIVSTMKHKMTVLKSLYKSFINTSFQLIFRTTIDGNITFANRLFLRHLGIKSYRKIKGTNVESLFEEPIQFKDIEKRLWQSTRIQSDTIHLRRTDGTRLTGLMNCLLCYDEGGIPVFNWTVLDISRQVDSENALKSKADQLAKVNNQMEKFLYSTSHDLRAPLTSILGLVNLMRMDSKEPNILDYAEKIETSTLKLDKIIKDIMSFSRTSYQHVKSEKIYFENLVWKVVNFYRTDPSVRKISFEVNAVENFPFYGDLDRLEIIVENIVRNAIHFYDVNKSKPFIRINIRTDKSAVYVEFMDNGVGIGKQYLQQIFNMFYKASHLSKGAGLGLYIVKEALAKLNGTITVESEIGFGTAFRISIPNDHKGKLIGRKLILQHNNRQ